MTRPRIRALRGIRQGGGGAPYPPASSGPSSLHTSGRAWFLESAGQRSPSSGSLRNRHHTAARQHTAAVQQHKGRGVTWGGAASGHSRAWSRAGLWHDDSHD